MTTIPSRLAQAARTSSSAPAVQRQRAIQLYREWYRSAPEICSLYTLPIEAPRLRHAIRARFERNRYVTDPQAIDILLHKSRLDFQETMNVWKLPDHVMNMVEMKERPKRTFLEKFYIGRDEEGVVPAATGVV